MTLKQLVAQRDKLIKKRAELQNALGVVKNDLKGIKILIRAAIAEEKNAKAAAKAKG